jgi:hypothetical protein
MQQCGADLIPKYVFVRAIFVAPFKIAKNTQVFKVRKRFAIGH